MDKCMEVVM